MKMFLSLMLSVSFASSLFAANYHPLSLCYEGGWEESCPSMDCCVSISANSTERYPFITQPACFEPSPPAVSFDILSEQFVQNAGLPLHRAILWLAQKTSLP